jgi:hypothetical protein
MISQVKTYSSGRRKVLVHGSNTRMNRSEASVLPGLGTISQSMVRSGFEVHRAFWGHVGRKRHALRTIKA